jgi:hypothetical protein
MERSMRHTFDPFASIFSPVKQQEEAKRTKQRNRVADFMDY